MRVNISYSAQIDDVPHELVRLITDVAAHLGSAATQLNRAEDLLAPDTALASAAETARLVDSVRRLLAKMDTRLQETEIILGGYYQVKTDPESVMTEQPPVEEELAEVQETLNGIQEDLQHMLSDSEAIVSEETEHADL